MHPSIRTTLALALLCTAISSAAVSLGRLQGQATLGKPLDVQIQVMWDSTDDTSDCLAADVSYGDTPLNAAQVTVRMDASAPTASMASSVRIFSSAVVNEPIVSINLRSGCRQKSARQYTLFTELPTAAPLTLTPTPVAAPAATPAPVANARELLPTAPPAAQAVTSSLAKPVAKAPRVAVASSAPSAAPPPAPKLPAPRASTQRKTDTRARLRLDPLDLLLEPEPALRIASELLTLPTDEATAERTQAAAWWRALNASPEDALRDAARLQSVQTDIQSLQTIAANNQKSLSDLTEKLQRANAEKYANGFAYSLMALCALSLLGLGIMWHRLRQIQTPSWSQALDPGDSLMAYPDSDHGTPKAKTHQPLVTTPVSAVPSAAVTAVDFDLNLMSENAKLAHRDFGTSMYPGARSMDTEELLDIRQQADFFLTLDQHDKAIELLSTRISQCGESSPLICLDLLKIYHGLGRKADFDLLRTEFNHWFTGRVPAFSAFKDEGRALSSYPPVINRITELWPAPSVLDYIESCIYQHSSTQPGSDFDLQAYRELLLLHSIAKRIMRLAYGNDDEHPSEFMRIPASAASVAAQGEQGESDSRAAAHRAGAHLRGTWNPGIEPEVADTQGDADIEPTVSPLGAMRVEVHLAPHSTPLDLELEPEPVKPADRPSDFNFVGLR